MQVSLLLAFEYLACCGCAGLAYAHGSRGERLGAAWFVATMIIGGVAYSLRLHSPLVHLVEDGVFALGLLPLAMIFVSYWIGLVTLIAAALFTLEAVYLLNDWPADNAYAWINNTLWLLVPVIFLISGVSNLLRNRRATGSECQASDAAPIGC